ncbi:MAG: acryloyl-CoA reductase [Burkholderiales bacterium]|nr:acryloyl-CoA reductase [Burkholderiales bacterium]
MSTFRAYRVFSEEGRVAGRLVDAALEELSPGEVVFRNAWSSVNYKDALAATGTGGRIIRSYPLIPGIDAAGVVESSTAPGIRPGDEVICTSYDFGVAHDGGFSQVCRVPAAWIVPLPRGLTLREAMALGTAGFTAGLAVELLQVNGLAPGGGKVLVNGATGGVASLAIDMLAVLGFEVTAVTGKDAEHDWLRALGAAEVLSRHGVEMGTRALEKPLWAAAFDSVGGESLAWLTRTMRQSGLIASFGNAGGIELKTTVLPFILRGVRLIGVDSAATPMPLRRRVWERLATELKPRHLGEIARVIALEDLAGCFARMLRGEARGRAVVAMS